MNVYVTREHCFTSTKRHTRAQIHRILCSVTLSGDRLEWERGHKLVWSLLPLPIHSMFYCFMEHDGSDNTYWYAIPFASFCIREMCDALLYLLLPGQNVRVSDFVCMRYAGTRIKRGASVNATKFDFWTAYVYCITILSSNKRNLEGSKDEEYSSWGFSSNAGAEVKWKSNCIWAKSRRQIGFIKTK